MIELTSCGARGKEGPRSNDCAIVYNNTDAMQAVRVLDEQPYKGAQVWRVPSTNYYT